MLKLLLKVIIIVISIININSQANLRGSSIAKGILSLLLLLLSLSLS